MLIVKSHLLQLNLHLDQNLTSWVNLWLKCALERLILDHAYLSDVLVLSLLVVLLPIPKLSELSILCRRCRFWRGDIVRSLGLLLRPVSPMSGSSCGRASTPLP